MRVELNKIEQEFIKRAIAARMSAIDAAHAREQKDIQFVLSQHGLKFDADTQIMADPDETIWVNAPGVEGKDLPPITGNGSAKLSLLSMYSAPEEKK